MHGTSLAILRCSVAQMRSFVSVPAIEGRVFELFEDIYLHDPWKINPRIFESNRDAVNDATRRVCEAARFGAGPKHSLRLAPLVNVRTKKNQIHELESGRIPSSATVTGEGGWETVFGKPEATSGWTWRELMEGIDKTSAWEYQICSMMAEAIKTRSVRIRQLRYAFLYEVRKRRKTFTALAWGEYQNLKRNTNLSSFCFACERLLTHRKTIERPCFITCSTWLGTFGGDLSNVIAG